MEDGGKCNRQNRQWIMPSSIDVDIIESGGEDIQENKGQRPVKLLATSNLVISTKIPAIQSHRLSLLILCCTGKALVKRIDKIKIKGLLARFEIIKVLHSHFLE